MENLYNTFAQTIIQEKAKEGTTPPPNIKIDQEKNKIRTAMMARLNAFLGAITDIDNTFNQ